MLLRALHESVTNHTDSTVLKLSLFGTVSELLAANEDGWQSGDIDRPPVALCDHRVGIELPFPTRRARTARWPRWGPEGPFRNLGSLLVGKAVASSMCSCPGSVVCVSRFLSVRCRLVVNLYRNSFTQGVMRDRPHPLAFPAINTIHTYTGVTGGAYSGRCCSGIAHTR